MLDVTGEGGLDVALHTPCLLEQLGSLLNLCTITLPSFSAQSKSALTLCDRQHVEWHNGVCVCTDTHTHTHARTHARTNARPPDARTHTDRQFTTGCIHGTNKNVLQQEERVFQHHLHAVEMHWRL